LVSVQVISVKTYPLNEARAEFSKLVERALGGEPQRVTRHGKEAVVIVSEEAFQRWYQRAPTLGALLAIHARRGLMSEPITDRPWKDRPIGRDFT
jgi:prevent-host-death family protein